MPTGLTDLQLPGGRLVMGSTSVKNATDQKGLPIPEDKQQYFIGVAVPKNDPGIEPLWGQLYNMAATDYASNPLVMGGIQQGLASTSFSWKIQDGDVATINQKTGQLRDIPDYMRGCWIFKFSTMFEFTACDFNAIEINKNDIKRGDFVDLIFSSSINGNQDHTAGIYLNIQAIRRLGFGDPISGQVSAAAAFAGRAAALPPGATTMPTAAGATPMPGVTPVAPAAPVAVPNAVQPATTANLPFAAPVAAGVPAPVAGLPAGSTASPSDGVPAHPGILNPPIG